MIELGKVWPKFNNEECRCELDKTLQIKFCTLHRVLIASEVNPSLLNEYDDYFLTDLQTEVIKSYSHPIEEANDESDLNASNKSQQLHIDNDTKLNCKIKDDECYDYLKEDSFSISSEVIDETVDLKTTNNRFDTLEKTTRILKFSNINEFAKVRFHRQEKSKEKIEIRYDVMNKNFIRAIKRELKRLLIQLTESELCNETKHSLDLSNELLASHLLENTSVQWRKIEDFSVDTFNSYLKALTKYCQFKNMRHNITERFIKDQVFNLLYSYSHTRFYSFINVPEIKVLIQILEEKYGIRGLIQLIDSSNNQSYENHLGSILKSICQINS